MGHYASEMTGPDRIAPEELDKRRREAIDSADYRWQLYQQYEEEGVWIRANETLICPRCFCQVPALLRLNHDTAVHSPEEANKDTAP